MGFCKIVISYGALQHEFKETFLETQCKGRASVSSTGEVTWAGSAFSAPQCISGFLVYIFYHLGKPGACHQLNLPIWPQEMDLGISQGLLDCWMLTGCLHQLWVSWVLGALLSLIVSVHYRHHQAAVVTTLNVTKNLLFLENSCSEPQKHLHKISSSTDGCGGIN